MLTRLYIDNFRCFVNFEYRPGRKQLILGANGAGKSSLIDGLLFLKGIAVGGTLIDETPLRFQKTRWITLSHQQFEVEADLADGTYLYKLALETSGEPSKSTVAHESLHLNGMALLEFDAGQVELHRDDSHEKVSYPLDPNRSSLASIPIQGPYTKLGRFKLWLSNIHCFRINPFALQPIAEGEDFGPLVNMSNLAAWYRQMLQSHPRENQQYLSSLREAIDGFDVLKLISRVGDKSSLLLAEFTSNDQGTLSFGLRELSEGQKCLLALYAILHFVAMKGHTIVIDEPDNFVSLREIQPWLNALSDAADDGKGQAISFHTTLSSLINGRPTTELNSFVKATAQSVSASLEVTQPAPCPLQN